MEKLTARDAIASKNVRTLEILEILKNCCAHPLSMLPYMTGLQQVDVMANMWRQKIDDFFVKSKGGKRNVVRSQS